MTRDGHLEYLKKSITDRTSLSGPITLLDRRRLDSIQELTDDIVQNGVKGDLVETGVWKGGACVFMQGLLRSYLHEACYRTLWVCDTFNGFPANRETRLGSLDLDEPFLKGDYSATLYEVQENFKKFNLLNSNVRFLEGKFEDTVGVESENCPIKKISLLRFDADTFSNVVEVLDGLYDKVSIGGYVIIDDLCILSCWKGVQYWFEKRNFRPTIINPYTRKALSRENEAPAGGYWRKEEVLGV